MSDFSTIEIKGDLLRVIHVDTDSNTIFVRYSDGRTGRLASAEAHYVARGDTILAHENGWIRVPDEVWPSTHLIVVIKDILDDGIIIADTGSSILELKNPDDHEVKPNFTVEVESSTLFITKIISKNPIRSRIHAADDDISPSSFLASAPSNNLTFDDFGGYRDVVSRAKNLIETQLERHKELEQIGARPVKGILFTGPPGTGKTHLARIIASQARADFYEISGPAIVSKWVGDTESMLRRIFDHAKASQSGKAIIFFDEIDSIAESRSGDSHEASRRLVSQFLTLMDGFDTSKSAIVVIAATNRVEALDPALMRPGRFDWEIEFGLPTFFDRLEILVVGSRRVKCTGELPLTEIAVRTHDWSAARLSSIWTEAALIAASDRRNSIAGEDMAQAYERVARRPERSLGNVYRK